MLACLNPTNPCTPGITVCQLQATRLGPLCQSMPIDSQTNRNTHQALNCRSQHHSVCTSLNRADHLPADMMHTSLNPHFRTQYNKHYSGEKQRPAALSASRRRHHTHVSTVRTARPSTTTAAVPPSKNVQPLQQQVVEQEQQQTINVNVSKRQLLAFGCACCLSLQAQQQSPAAADSGHYSYEGGQEHGPALQCCSRHQRNSMLWPCNTGMCAKASG